MQTPVRAESERVLLIVRFNHVVTVRPEHISNEPPDIVFVFDQQDCLRTSTRNLKCFSWRKLSLRFYARDVYQEAGSDADRTFDRNRSVVLMQNGMDRRQAQTRAAILG